MSDKVNPIPEEYRAATPYLICKGADKAVEFYKAAFGAIELFRMASPDGKIGHCEIRIGRHAILMLADEFPDMGAVSPQSLGGSPITIYIYVEDVDALASQAERAGAKILRPPTNQFYGDRSVMLEDPFGHKWGFASRVEEVSPEEMDRRAAEYYANE